MQDSIPQLETSVTTELTTIPVITATTKPGFDPLFVPQFITFTRAILLWLPMTLTAPQAISGALGWLPRLQSTVRSDNSNASIRFARLLALSACPTANTC